MTKDEIQAALYALMGIDEMLMGRENPQHIYYIETIRAALQSALDASQSTEPISFVKWEENGVRLKTRHHEFIVTTPPQVKAETVDLDAMRDHFEKWMTANGDYPHLIHKHFGGNYLREETSMKWDGFKQGVKYAQR